MQISKNSVIKPLLSAIEDDDTEQMQTILSPFFTFDLIIAKNKSLSPDFMNEPHIADIAAYYGSEECLRLIVVSAINALAYRDKDGATIAHYAAHSGNRSIFDFLINQNVSFNTLSKSLKYPLHIAAANGHTDLCQRFWLQSVPLDDLSAEGYTPLQYAAISFHYQTVDFFMNAGCDPNIYTSKGKTLFNMVIDSNDVEGQSFLLEHHVKQISDQRGNYPIHEAIEKRRMELIGVLIDAGADIEATDRKGQTPLIIAADRGYYDIAILLLDHGADLNAVDNNGCTPLHLASKCGNLAIVELLVDFGADVEIEDNAYHTAMNLAFLKNRHDIVELFLELGLSNDNLREMNPDTRRHVRNPKWGNRMRTVTIEDEL